MSIHKTVLFVQGHDTAVKSNVVTENHIETYGLQLVLSKLLSYQEFISEIKIWGWHSNNMVRVNWHVQLVISRGARLGRNPEYICKSDENSRYYDCLIYNFF